MSAQKLPAFNDESAIRSYLQLLARYERLMEISRQLTSTLDLRTLLNRIIQAATELTDTEEASILLVDEKSGELRFEAATRLTPGAMEAIVVPISSIAGWIVQHGEPVLVEDSEHEPRLYRTVGDIVQHQTKNMLGVPMIAHERVIGVVEAINKRNKASWNEDDVSTLTTLAAQAAIAIENARLFQQSDFVSEIVHELRTPLLALKASTTLLMRPDLPARRRDDIVQTMQSETDRLTKLTTDFLDLARLESGRTKLEMARYNVMDLITESVEIVRPQAETRGVTLTAHGDPATWLEGDRGKIKQVLLNLLTNAIKYNREHGQITVDASPDGAVEGVPMTRIAVSDTGHGISPDDLQHMFEKFFRVAETAGQTPGTGLGLVIARHIVEAHGGKIGVTSEVGVGTTFFFNVPTASDVNINRKTALPLDSAAATTPPTGG
ncbi:MAG: sensor histidine kinase [Aggregatilineales bacterium]